MRIAHGYDDSRMPKQLLHCHYIHSSIQQPRRERVMERMPRNILNLSLSTSQSEGRLEINERFSGLVVVENELVLSA
jgi:hypothetical protein